MPYNSEVRVAVQSGSPFSGAVALQLWEISTTIDNAGRIRQQQVDQERVTTAVAGGVATAFSTMDGPSYTSRNNHDISLTAYQDPQPGPIFRSGRLVTLPPGSPGDPSSLVDVMLLNASRFTMAEINSMIPTPITLPDGNVVTTATVASAPPSRILTLTATGPYGATTYTYTLPFTIDPSDDQVDLSRVLEANTAGASSLTFVASPGGGFQAFLNNLFAGLFVGQITTRVLTRITAELNTAAAAGAAAAVAAAGFTGGLPAGVILGVRSVNVASNGDIVMSPAIGTFGSIINKFLSDVPASGTGCFVATAVHGADSIEVSTLRIYRDEFLSTNRQGRVLVALYERLSPAAAALIARSPVLRLIARKLIVRPAYLVARRRLTANRGGRSRENSSILAPKGLFSSRASFNHLLHVL